MIRRSFLRVSAALAPMIALVPAVARAQADAVTTIRFSAYPGDDLRPVLYAQSSGMFKQAGLNVVMQIAQNGGITTPAVVGGAADVGKTTLTSLIAAHARGVPLVLITPSMIYRKDAPTSGVLVAANSPIHTPRDLEGKVVACAALGGLAYLGLRAVVDEQGGDSSLVRFVELPGAAVPAAIEAGRFDAGVTEEPFMTASIRGGKVRLLVDMFDGFPRPILESVFFTTRDFANNHHAAIARFAKVIQDAARYTNTHEAETLPLFIALSGMDPALANQMHHSFTPVDFDPTQIQPVIDLSVKYKAIPNAFDARDLLQ